MATNKKMQQTVELNAPLMMQEAKHLMVEGDNLANTIILEVMEGGKPADLTGYSATAYMIREDGQKPFVKGTVEGNVVTVCLNEEFYVVPGRYYLFVRLTHTDGTKCTLLWLTGWINGEGQGDVIDTGNVVPDLDDLLAQIDAMEKATAAANEAAASVEGFKAEINDQVSQLSEEIDLLDAAINNTSVDYKYSVRRSTTYRLVTTNALPMRGRTIAVTASGQYNFAPVKPSGSVWASWRTNWTANISEVEEIGVYLWIQKTDKSEITDEEIDEAIASVTVVYDFSADNKVAYVSTSGNDSNDGTFDAPYATVSKAIEAGHNKILIYGGVYEQTITLPESGTVDIAPAEETSIPVFVDPERLKITSATIYSGNVYVADATFAMLNDTPMIFQDGVADATTLISNAERMPQQRGKEYRCDDTMIRKCDATVLEDAVTEMQGADTYKFFYDANNGKLYFTAPSTDFATHPVICSSNGSLFAGLSRAITLHVTGIECKYMRFDISNTINSVIADCKCSCAYASALGQFMYNDAINPRFINCEAAMSHGKNNGDGFNSHASTGGDPFAHQSGVVLENCWSHDNKDDGWSDHHRGEAMIYGGLYEYNGKGGITPSYGTHAICRDVYSRHNYAGYNYVAEADDGGMYGQLICYNCVAEANNRAGAKAGFVVGGENNKMVLINCKTINNDVGYKCTNASNAMRLIDCGSFGDGTAIGATGTYEIVNTERLSAN